VTDEGRDDRDRSGRALKATQERYVTGETDLREFEDQLGHALDLEQHRASNDSDGGPGFGPVSATTDSADERPPSWACGHTETAIGFVSISSATAVLCLLVAGAFVFELLGILAPSAVFVFILVMLGVVINLVVEYTSP
jgi:hypothetical protein